MKGKIEVIKKLQNLDWGKKIKINQKGIAPIFNHKYIISIVKKDEICSNIINSIILQFLLRPLPYILIRNRSTHKNTILTYC